MEDYREEVLSGFCKALNQTRTVFCEIGEREGREELLECDCDYGDCPHTEACILMGQLKEALK